MKIRFSVQNVGVNLQSHITGSVSLKLILTSEGTYPYGTVPRKRRRSTTDFSVASLAFSGLVGNAPKGELGYITSSIGR